ncbi:Mitochondrial import inner membrane translocase subunit [Dirofilaria immitis]
MPRAVSFLLPSCVPRKKNRRGWVFSTENSIMLISISRRITRYGMDISSKNPSIVSTDPNWNLFLHQLQAENQRQKFTEQVQTLTGRCWDVCFSDYRPPKNEYH